jgi:hypothetical protein
MKKFINSFASKSVLVSILFCIFCNSHIAAEEHYTNAEIAEITCASLSFIPDIVVNTVKDKNSSMAIKLSLINHLLCTINNCLTLYNYKNGIELFSLESLAINALGVCVDIQNLVDIKKQKKSITLNIEQPKTQETDIIKTLNITLPIIRSIVNTSAGLNDSDTRLCRLQREGLHGVALLTTLIDLFLKAKTKSVKNMLAILIFLNALKVDSLHHECHEEEKHILRQSYIKEIKKIEKDLTDLQQRNGRNEEFLLQERQVHQQLRARLDDTEKRLGASRQQCVQLGALRQSAVREYQNASKALDMEKKVRNQAASELRIAGENRRHELFGAKKIATPKELRAAYEALLLENAVLVDD